MSEGGTRGVLLMREHELTCERETRENEPDLTKVLQDAVNCIVESVHAFEGLSDLPEADQALLTEIVLGARAARVFLALLLTGHYETALAVARTLIEDGVACAYLVEHPEHAARWRRGEIELKYGDMAAAMIAAHAQRAGDDIDEADAWRRAGDALHQVRQVLDDVSHANPARIAFVLGEAGYELHPLFDRHGLRLTTYLGLIGLLQMLFLTRKRLGDYGRTPPPCNSDGMRQRMVALFERLHDTGPNGETRRSGSGIVSARVGHLDLRARV